MKNKKLKKIVLKIIVTYMKKKIAFTSVDICNHIRSEYPEENIPHGTIGILLRKYVLNVSFINCYMYDINLISVDSNKGRRTYLYHHFEFECDNYMSRDLTTIKTLK